MVEPSHFTAPANTRTPSPQPAPPEAGLGWRWGALGLGVIITAALLAIFASPRNDDQPPLILVAAYQPVAHESSHPALGIILADWVAFSLGRTGRVEVLDGSTRIHTLLRSRSDTNEDHTHRARILARETGARWLLTGDYFQIGDSLAVVTRVTDAGSGEVLHSFRTATLASEYPATLLDLVLRDALNWMLERGGSSTASQPPPDTQAPALEAYVTYLTAAQHWVGGARHLADPLFKDALAADPRLAGPMAWLVGALDPTWPWQWRDSLAESLAGREVILPDADRVLLNWWQARRGEDATQALDAARASVRAAPASSDAKYWAALVAVEMGDAATAAELFAQVRTGFDRLSAGVNPSTLLQTGAWAFHEIGDYPAELAWLDLFSAETLAGMSACRRAVSVRALMQPDLDFDAAASRCRSESPDSLGTLPARLRLDAATELRAHGALGHADRIAREAIILYERATANEPSPVWVAATYWGNLGHLRLLTGDWPGSREAFARALALEGEQGGSRWWGWLGVAHARAGEVAESERVLDRLQSADIPGLAFEQARIHASLGRIEEANAILDRLPPGRFSARTRVLHDVAFDGMRPASGAPR
ncbi:MAG: tetratricopeptide repeat protein [Gemmatimonadales bacterium]